MERRWSPYFLGQISAIHTSALLFYQLPFQHTRSLTHVRWWGPIVSASPSAAAFCLIDPFCSRLGPKEEVNMSSYSKRQVGASVNWSSLEKPVSPNFRTFLYFILKYSDLTVNLWISAASYSLHTSLFPEFWAGCVAWDLTPCMQIYVHSCFLSQNSHQNSISGSSSIAGGIARAALVSLSNSPNVLCEM